jgi:hypothetical protein
MTKDLSVAKPGAGGTRPRRGLTSLARLGVESGGALTERTNDSVLALNTALDRLSCIYSLGFRDDDFHSGRPKSVNVTLRRKNLRAFHAEAYVLRTEAGKRESLLLAAFVDPKAADDGSLRALLIPRGGDGAKWKVAVQLRMRPHGHSGNSAELGASIVRHDTVTDHFASSIATKAGSRAIVLEKTLAIAPGDFSVVAVARDVESDGVSSSRLDASWPNPAHTAAAITPVAVLQAGPASMSKDGAFASSGSLARDLDESLDPSVDISLISVVCRGAGTMGPVIVERWLEGGSRSQFVALTIAETDEPCHETVDVVPGRRLSPGEVDYRVTVRVGDEIVAQEHRRLRIGVPF